MPTDRLGPGRSAISYRQLKDASRWKDCPYVALNNDDPRLYAPSSTNGKNVFKETMRTVALWVEDEIVPKHDDQW